MISQSAWPDGKIILTIFGPLQQWFFPPKKVAKVGWQFCQISNKPSKNCQRLIKFRQSGSERSQLTCVTFYRTTPWTATSASTGGTNVSASRAWGRTTLTSCRRISSAWTSRCWRRSGSRTRISTTAWARTYTPSPGRTSCWGFLNTAI